MRNQKSYNTLWPGLCTDNLLTAKGVLNGVFLANHLASTDNQNNQETEHIQMLSLSI